MTRTFRRRTRGKCHQITRTIGVGGTTANSRGIYIRMEANERNEVCLLDTDSGVTRLPENVNPPGVM